MGLASHFCFIDTRKDEHEVLDTASQLLDHRKALHAGSHRGSVVSMLVHQVIDLMVGRLVGRSVGLLAARLLVGWLVACIAQG